MTSRINFNFLLSAESSFCLLFVPLGSFVTVPGSPSTDGTVNHDSPTLDFMEVMEEWPLRMGGGGGGGTAGVREDSDDEEEEGGGGGFPTRLCASEATELCTRYGGGGGGGGASRPPLRETEGGTWGAVTHTHTHTMKRYSKSSC